MIFAYIAAALVAVVACLAVVAVVLVVLIREVREVFDRLVNPSPPPEPVQAPLKEDHFYEAESAEVVRLPPWESWGEEKIPDVPA